jgi:hypothetical protein
MQTAGGTRERCEPDRSAAPPARQAHTTGHGGVPAKAPLLARGPCSHTPPLGRSRPRWTRQQVSAGFFAAQANSAHCQ